MPIRDVLNALFASPVPDLELNPAVRNQLEQVLHSLMALARSSPRSTYQQALRVWVQSRVPQGTGFNPGARLFGIIRTPGCSWYRCPLYESKEGKPDGEMLRCSGCGEVRSCTATRRTDALTMYYSDVGLLLWHPVSAIVSSVFIP